VYKKIHGRKFMDKIFVIFIFAFFAISAVGIVASMIYGKTESLSKSCRRAALMSFVIGLIILYLHYVFK